MDGHHPNQGFIAFQAQLFGFIAVASLSLEHALLEGLQQPTHRRVVTLQFGQ